MTNDTHYVDFDPDAIMTAMQLAYIEAGGDVLYPGDEKEMFLRGVQAYIVHTLAAVDNALRMATLQYAVGEYLDLYGEKRNCIRFEAARATAQVTITFTGSGKRGTIPAGSALTADGEIIYLLDAAVDYTGMPQSVRADVTCDAEGTIGNGLAAGTQLQFLNGFSEVESVYCTRTASGGENTETDDAYRERIRNYGLANVATGPRSLYENAALGVSSLITDAHAVMTAPGSVGVYLLVNDTTMQAAIVAAVQNVLSDNTTRPLTDHVTVTPAEPVPYVLKVEYAAPADAGTEAALAAAVEEYRAWQERKIGRPFNPEMLMALLYQYGATRVRFSADSTFRDEPNVGYTEIADNEYCKGTIEMAVIE